MALLGARYIVLLQNWLCNIIYGAFKVFSLLKKGIEEPCRIKLIFSKSEDDHWKFVQVTPTLLCSFLNSVFQNVNKQELQNIRLRFNFVLRKFCRFKVKKQRQKWWVVLLQSAKTVSTWRWRKQQPINECLMSLFMSLTRTIANQWAPPWVNTHRIHTNSVKK